MKKLGYQPKDLLVSLAGKCFWYWGSFYTFLDSCGVPKSLYARFPKDSFSKYDVMRNILTTLEEQRNFEVVENIVSEFYNLEQPVDKDNIDTTRARELLDEFRRVVGDDPIERKIKQKRAEAKRQKAQKKFQSVKTKSSRRNELHKYYLKLLTNKKFSPAKRGFKLEELFFDLLDLEEFEITRPYKTRYQQIDGRFKYEKFDYLVEIKWIKDLITQKHLSVFDGKIRKKAQSTRGFMLSMNGFNMDSINDWKGDSPRILLFSGQELTTIIEGYRTFYDIFKSKVTALVEQGEMFYQMNL